MATDAIKNPNAIEDISSALSYDSTKIEFASWGNLTGVRIGNIAFIRIHGFHSKAAISTPTRIVTISGYTFGANAAAPFFTGNAVDGIITISVGTDNIAANSFSASTANGSVYFAIPIVPT